MVLNYNISSFLGYFVVENKIMGQPELRLPLPAREFRHNILLLLVVVIELKSYYDIID